MELAKAYKIETERLIIRCYHPEDAFLLKKSIDESLDHLLPWMPWAGNEPVSIEKKIDRLRKYRGQFDLGEDYVFGIFNKNEDKLIGSTGLHTRAGEHAREIGYWIHVNEIQKGYALEAAGALTKVGFEIEGLERIEIHCTPANIRSQNIPRKLGYVNEGTLRNRATDAQKNKPLT
ncbi:MAG: GNAT family protein [Saprospiraceae bacterium]